MVNSKRKGKNGELELAAYLRDAGFEARRSVQYSGDHEDADADLISTLPVHVEVKRVEALNLGEAYAQACRDSGTNGKPPAVFHRKNRKPWMVSLSLEHFLALVVRD